MRTVRRAIVERLMRGNKWTVDEEPHIRVDTKLCERCETRPCVVWCPAGCYEVGEDGSLSFSYEGCLECGTCRLVCPLGAVRWGYPRGGYGVSYRVG